MLNSNYAITKINNFDTDTALYLFIAKIQRIDKNDFKNSTEILTALALKYIISLQVYCYLSPAYMQQNAMA